MNKIEKFLFSTVEKWVLMLTVFSMFLFAVFFGVLVRQELIGTQKLGTISKAALFFAEIPVYIKQLGQDEIVLANSFNKVSTTTNSPLLNERLNDFCGDVGNQALKSYRLGLFFFDRETAELYVKEIAKSDLDGAVDVASPAVVDKNNGTPIFPPGS